MPTMLNVKESLQVSYLGAFISTGKRQIGVPFLIKNITDNILNVEILPLSVKNGLLLLFIQVGILRFV